MAVSERATIAQSILSTLKLREKSALKCPPIKIKASLFGETRKALHDNRPSDALRLLTVSGVNSASAQAMLETQQHPVANTTIGYLKGRDGEVTASGFTVIEGDNGLWIATSPENKPGLDADLLISPASGGEVIERVKMLVK